MHYPLVGGHVDQAQLVSLLRNLAYLGGLLALTSSAGLQPPKLKPC